MYVRERKRGLSRSRGKSVKKNEKGFYGWGPNIPLEFHIDIRNIFHIFVKIYVKVETLL